MLTPDKKCPNSSACHAGQGVAISPERNGLSDAVFIVARVQKCDYGFRHCSLTGNIKAIRQPDFLNSPVQIIVKPATYFFTDEVLSFACPRGSGALEYGGSPIPRDAELRPLAQRQKELTAERDLWIRCSGL